MQSPDNARERRPLPRFTEAGMGAGEAEGQVGTSWSTELGLESGCPDSAVCLSLCQLLLSRLRHMFGVQGRVRQKWAPANSLTPTGGSAVEPSSVTDCAELVQTPRARGSVRRDGPTSGAAAKGLPGPTHDHPHQACYFPEQLSDSESALML